LTLQARPSAPAEARVAVRGVLVGWGLPELCDTAMLLCSELVTNAVRHAGTTVRISLDRLPDRTVRVAVMDGAPRGHPRVVEPGEEDESGRGMWLVDRLSSGWGTDHSKHGKAVWFELSPRELVIE
jgi:anti-sigma regulatory factor (Ser/Thr protein kinase)